MTPVHLAPRRADDGPDTDGVPQAVRLALSRTGGASLGAFQPGAVAALLMAVTGLEQRDAAAGPTASVRLDAIARRRRGAGRAARPGPGPRPARRRPRHPAHAAPRGLHDGPAQHPRLGARRAGTPRLDAVRAAAVALDECISPPGQRRLQWSPERARFRLTRTAVRAVRVATADAVHGR